MRVDGAPALQGVVERRLYRFFEDFFYSHVSPNARQGGRFVVLVGHGVSVRRYTSSRYYGFYGLRVVFYFCVFRGVLMASLGAVLSFLRTMYPSVICGLVLPIVASKYSQAFVLVGWGYFSSYEAGLGSGRHFSIFSYFLGLFFSSRVFTLLWGVQHVAPFGGSSPRPVRVARYFHFFATSFTTGYRTAYVCGVYFLDSSPLFTLGCTNTVSGAILRPVYPSLTDLWTTLTWTVDARSMGSKLRSDFELCSVEYLFSPSRPIFPLQDAGPPYKVPL